MIPEKETELPERARWAYSQHNENEMYFGSVLSRYWWGQGNQPPPITQQSIVEPLYLTASGGSHLDHAHKTSHFASQCLLLLRFMVLSPIFFLFLRNWNLSHFLIITSSSSTYLKFYPAIWLEFWIFSKLLMSHMCIAILLCYMHRDSRPLWMEVIGFFLLSKFLWAARIHIPP